MELTACPACNTQVSQTAVQCPSCGHVLRKPKRSIFGKICKWIFIAFNVVMLIWLVTYWGDIGGMVSGEMSDAEAAGAAIGATLGTGFLVSFWMAGDVILGLFVLLTRPKIR